MSTKRQPDPKPVAEISPRLQRLNDKVLEAFREDPDLMFAVAKTLGPQK